jgi:hypothetical protein
MLQIRFILIILLLSILQLNSHPYHYHNKVLSEAIGFINDVLQPKNCTGLEYTVVGVGIAGGFAAQFQLVAAEWMRAFAGLNYQKPVIIMGKLMGYSDGKQCEHVNHEWTCFFHEMSSCQNELLKSGKRIDVPSTTYDDNQNIPPQFRHLGLAFWWGVVQYKMFRILPFVEKHIVEQSRGESLFPFFIIF